MYGSAFWNATVERAIKTGAQAAIATFGVGAGLFDIDWEAALSMTGGAIVLSVLTSVASAGTGGDASPSFGGAERLDPAPGKHLKGSVTVIDEDKDDEQA